MQTPDSLFDIIKQAETCRNQPAAAVAHYQHAIRALQVKLAEVLQSAGDLPQALSAYEQALAGQEDLPASLYQGFIAALERAGQGERALRVCEQALEFHPGHHGLWTRLGALRRRNGLFQQAGMAYRQALTVQVQNQHITRTSVLHHFIQALNARTYLEIGLASGRNFFPLSAARKIGVDPILGNLPGGRRTDPECTLYEIPSDDFFAQQGALLQQNPPEVVFIDGLHTYEQSRRDVLNALPYLKQPGVIVLHDCLPTSPAAAHPRREEAHKLPGWNGQWMGDVWKTIVELRVTRPDLYVCVLNADCGLGIVIPGRAENQLKFPAADLAKLRYQDLIQQPQALLNLKPAEFLFQLLREKLPLKSGNQKAPQP